MAGYDIYRNGAKIGTTTGTSYADSGLAASTTYSYYVVAFDAAGNRAASNTIYATTAAVVPAAPSNLTAKVTSRKAALTWRDNANNESGFYVYQSSDGINWTRIATVAAKSGTGGTVSYTTGTLAKGTWFFKVTAYADGESAASNVASVTI